MTEIPNLTTAEAIKYVAENFSVPSKYALAKLLSDEELTIQPTQISNYLQGTKMSKKVADRFYKTFGIVITDAYPTQTLIEELGD